MLLTTNITQFARLLNPRLSDQATKCFQLNFMLSLVNLITKVTMTSRLTSSEISIARFEWAQSFSKPLLSQSIVVHFIELVHFVVWQNFVVFTDVKRILMATIWSMLLGCETIRKSSLRNLGKAYRSPIQNDHKLVWITNSGVGVWEAYRLPIKMCNNFGRN